MRKALGVGLVLLAWGAFANASEPSGFGDLQWGSPAPKSWQRKHGGDDLVHSARGRGSAFGTVPLERIDYEFSGGALVRVSLVFKERAGFLSLQRELESDFQKPGAPTPASPSTETLCWRGQTTWAYLNYLGEGVPGLLFLCRAPEEAAPEALPIAEKERLLWNRLRLYEHLDGILEKSLKAIASELAWTERSLQESMPQNMRCRDVAVEREQDQIRDVRTQRDQMADQDATAAERARLSKEAEKVRAELAALRKK